MVNNDIKHPVYIISKGRYENPKTAKVFLNDGVDFKIAVEPQEYNKYCNSIPSKFVCKLPFSGLGVGSFPARNWCWDDSIKNGATHHFLFDDNINGFIRFNHGKRYYKKYGNSIESKEALSTLDKFQSRYKNIAISGFNYHYFCPNDTKKPFTYNTHVYSGMLINNKIPYRWRLKYNEDVDICLQALHDKWNTILINAVLMLKTSTVAKMKGGNQTELYKGNSFDKKVLKTKSLELIWPQYVKSTIRFGRPHHVVSWKKHFKHTLIKA